MRFKADAIVANRLDCGRQRDPLACSRS